MTATPPPEGMRAGARAGTGRGSASALTWPLRLVVSLLRFLGEIVRANLRVAYEVATPGFHMQPAIMVVPTRARGPVELVLLANAISLTPGTLTLEVDEPRRMLYVHTLYAPSREEFLTGIVRLEDILLDATRLHGRSA